MYFAALRLRDVEGTINELGRSGFLGRFWLDRTSLVLILFKSWHGTEFAVTFAKNNHEIKRKYILGAICRRSIT